MYSAAPSDSWVERSVSLSHSAWKEQFRGSRDLSSLLEIVSDRLYGQSVHWALELIQNAEDEGARRIIFVFDRDHIEVINDGRPFSARDVWAVCSAGGSAKK